jgi:hypothetical protein
MGRVNTVLHGSLDVLLLFALVDYHLWMTVFLAAFLRPVLLFVLLACILLPIRFAVARWWPEGKVKRLLLREI